MAMETQESVVTPNLSSGGTFVFDGENLIASCIPPNGDELAAIANARLFAAAAQLLDALGPLAMAARTQADLLRHQARDATSGVARALIEAAERWERLHDAGAASIAKAIERT